ncbi:MAG: Ig-like domain-containing protein, partial [Armatimonadetes bacterium]|nr:Ig-like domain-containing protein [Armatimonadota bacterium]MDW8154881.1 Ig-like domain-containing protein [Armatimonadota bacterium]
MARFRAFQGAALAVVAALVAAACGAAPTAPATPTPTPPPPTPPPAPTFSVTATVPASGATGVAPTTVIRITFNAAVANAGPGNPCAAGNILIAPAPVAGPTACTILAGGNAVELTGLVLNSSTTYTVTVQPQVASATGVQLGGTGFSFSFTTRFWTTPPTTVNAVFLQDGTVCDNGPVVPSSLVGDDDAVPVVCPSVATTGGSPDRFFRAFQAFGSPVGLAGAVIISATYTGEQAVLGGNPYVDLGGALLVEGVNWLVSVTPGVLDATDFGAPAVGPTVLAA